jgi:hypothetical protein
MQLELTVKDPIVRGALALFPAFSDAPEAPDYRTGPGAEAAGVLRVSEQETGTVVPELVVHNSGDQPVLLLEGETLIGAKQNRTLNVSLLVPAGTHLPVPVSCVEAGRWGAARSMARSPRHAPGDLRRLNTRAVAESRRRGMGSRADQGAVWDRVAAYQADLGAPSATSALEDVYGRVDTQLTDLLGELTPLPDQRGVILAIGGTVRGIDWFDKASTLAAYWPGLVQGYAVDALHTPSGDATIADAEAFVAQVLTAPATPEDAVGLGQDLVIADDAVAGHALEWNDAVVHLAAFATEAIPDRPRAGGRIDRSRWSR